MRDVFIDRLKKEGIKGFYKGIGVTLYRACFVNAGGFLAFESTMRVLGRNEDSQWSSFIGIIEIINCIID